MQYDQHLFLLHVGEHIAESKKRVDPKFFCRSQVFWRPQVFFVDPKFFCWSQVFFVDPKFFEDPKWKPCPSQSIFWGRLLSWWHQEAHHGKWSLRWKQMQRKSSRHIHVCIKLFHNLQCLNQVSSCKESKKSPLDPSCGLNSEHTSGCISDIGNAERCWHSARKAFFQQYFRRSSSYSSIMCITYIWNRKPQIKNFYIFYIARLFYIFYTLRKNIQHN